MTGKLSSETGFVENLIHARTANLYDSAGLGSFCPTTQSKSSYYQTPSDKSEFTTGLRFFLP
jgi:hypothetical protein